MEREWPSVRTFVEVTWPYAYSEAVLLTLNEQALVGKIVPALVSQMVENYNRSSYHPSDLRPSGATSGEGLFISHDHIIAYERAILTFKLLGLVQEVHSCVFRLTIAPSKIGDWLLGRSDLNKRMLGAVIEDLFNFYDQCGPLEVPRDIARSFLAAGLIEECNNGVHWSDAMTPYTFLTMGSHWNANLFFTQLTK